MAYQESIAVRNARINSIETTIGTAAVLKIRTGAQPADCATADSGTVLVSMILPSDWMGAASSGSASKLGTWSGTAGAGGTAGYFRVYASDGTTCGAQGSVTATGGGGDMTVDNTSIASGQTVTVNTFSITAGNA